MIVFRGPAAALHPPAADLTRAHDRLASFITDLSSRRSRQPEESAPIAPCRSRAFGHANFPDRALRISLQRRLLK